MLLGLAPLFRTAASTSVGDLRCEYLENRQGIDAERPRLSWGFDDSAWVTAKKLGPVGMAPWGNVRSSEERRLPARWLRKEFVAEKKVQRATVYLSGLGLSELHLNGSQVWQTHGPRAGIELLDMKAGRALFLVESGEYHFVSW